MDKQIVKLGDYETVAMVQVPDGVELRILNKASTHFLVVQVWDGPVGDCDPDEGKVLASFGYYGNAASAIHAYRRAFQKLNDLVERSCRMVASEENAGDWLDSCPGCGSMPGDGVSAECKDDAGCGYWRSIARGGSRPRQGSGR